MGGQDFLAHGGRLIFNEGRFARVAEWQTLGT
jgi:hypothetical protein